VEARRETMKYKIALRRSKEGYSVWVPGLPGCWSEGATRREAIENIQAAIWEYLSAVDDLRVGAPAR
jgi:predicted RNase H-like HicB family nuclease